MKHLLNLCQLKKIANQPPSGGCVLKQVVQTALTKATGPAAFGRLCVETQSAAVKVAKA